MSQQNCICGQPLESGSLDGPRTAWTHEFVLQNDVVAIRDLVATVQSKIEVLKLTQREIDGVGIAVEEAVVNAIHYGNLELSSDQRHCTQHSFDDRVAERIKEKPFCDRRVKVYVQICQHVAVIRVCDEGPGFCVADLADPLALENLERPGGRGIMLMRELMDDVTFNSNGNEVCLVKRSR
ncbi:MAG: ATP-binding protein [Pirellulaceae bacterium]|nr:ATP-binding protein [Pirellulaceae bacterium]